MQEYGTVYLENINLLRAS